MFRLRQQVLLVKKQHFEASTLASLDCFISLKKLPGLIFCFQYFDFSAVWVCPSISDSKLMMGKECMFLR